MIYIVKQIAEVAPQKSSVSRAITPATGSDMAAPGLVLTGKVLGRTRTEFKKPDQPTRYVFTLKVLAGSEVHKVDVWRDDQFPADMPPVGTEVSLRVAVRTFIRGNAAVASLTLENEADDKSF